MTAGRAADEDPSPFLLDSEVEFSESGQDDKQGVSCCYVCKSVCKLTCGVICVLFALWLLILLTFSWLPMQCEHSRRKYNVRDTLPEQAAKSGVLPPLDIGNANNMSMDPGLEIDLEGLWWMDGNPAPEYLVSFVGSKAELPFPSIMSTPNSMAGRWAWDTSLLAWVIMSYYAYTVPAEETLITKFVNSSYAEIVPVTESLGDKFLFINIDKNSWNRKPTYILRRVVMGDGTPHPTYWGDFIKYYESIVQDGKMASWNTDNNCMRKCQVLYPCQFCNMFC